MQLLGLFFFLIYSYCFMWLADLTSYQRKLDANIFGRSGWLQAISVMLWCLPGGCIEIFSVGSLCTGHCQ